MMDRRTAAYLVENIHEKSTFQFEQCEKCGAIVPKEKQVEEPKKPKRTIKKGKEE